MTERLLGALQVVEVTSLSRKEIDRREKAGAFPRRIRISPGRVAWVQSEVEAWIKDIIKTAREETNNASV